MKLRIPIKDVAQSPAQWTDGQLTVSGVSYDSFVQMFRNLPRGTQSRLLARLTQTRFLTLETLRPILSEIAGCRDYLEITTDELIKQIEKRT